MQRTTHIGTRRPVGFSLVELLVVISILIALIAIAIPTIGNILDSGRRAATLVTIEKADSLLKDQIAAFNRKMDETNEVAQKAREDFFQMNFTPRAAEIAARKALFQTHFPQNAAEAVGTYDHINPSSAYSEWVAKNIVGPGDNSELLYLTLTEGRYSGAGSGGDVDFSGSELVDTDPDPDDVNGDGKYVGDGFMELVDAWGNPLRFYRWPTGLRISESLTGDPDSLSGDPDDPRGELTRPGAVRSGFDFEASFHTIDSYHTPLIVSAGSDEMLGLFEPYDRERPGLGHLAEPEPDPDGDMPLADNLTNLTGGLSN